MYHRVKRQAGQSAIAPDVVTTIRAWAQRGMILRFVRCELNSRAVRHRVRRSVLVKIIPVDVPDTAYRALFGELCRTAPPSSGRVDMTGDYRQLPWPVPRDFSTAQGGSPASGLNVKPWLYSSHGLARAGAGGSPNNQFPAAAGALSQSSR